MIEVDCVKPVGSVNFVGQRLGKIYTISEFRKTLISYTKCVHENKKQYSLHNTVLKINIETKSYWDRTPHDLVCIDDYLD